MAYLEKFVARIAHGLDRIAQWALVIMMGLIVANIILRFVWQPILGVYEFVSFLGAIVISFALAYCALKKGHIAVNLLVDRLPKRSQALIDSAIDIISLVLFGFATWQLTIYATDILISGEVSATTKTPFSPFVYGVAIGFLALCLVLIIDVVRSILKVIGK